MRRLDAGAARAVSRATGLQDKNYNMIRVLATTAVLLLAGCVLDIFSATVVLVPLLVPLGAAFGMDPLHLAIVFLVAFEVSSTMIHIRAFLGLLAAMRRHVLLGMG